MNNKAKLKEMPGFERLSLFNSIVAPRDSARLKYFYS